MENYRPSLREDIQSKKNERHEIRPIKDDSILGRVIGKEDDSS